MEFRVLGPLEIADGDRAIDVRRGIPRLVLLALILRVGETVSTGYLADLVWGDDQPANPANAMQTQFSYLRRTLASHSPEARDLIVTRPGGYVLDIAPEQVDAVRFERSVERALRQADVATEAALHAALGELDRALALWRGDALSDSGGHQFAVAEGARLEELRVTAIEARLDCLLSLGRHREVATELLPLVDRYPLHERFHEQLVVALYRCGRQADALRAFERARSILRDELGLDPGPSLQRTERLVLEQSPELDWITPTDAIPPPAAGSTAGSRPRRRGTLPAPVSTLIGRDDDIERVHEVISQSRLVTLTGPGGAGKTALAVTIAHVEQEAEEVWFADLSGVSDPSAVGLAVAAALGIPTPPSEDPVEALALGLGHARGLLVLDTCEHVVDGAARTVSTLLQRCRELRVLATSRRPIGVRGEVAWPVPPLEVPAEDGTPEEISVVPAVRLFAERASALGRQFVVTEQNAADIAAICVALDGLPLAIELAAAQSDVLSPAAIRARLRDRFALLVEGDRDAAVRQQTLRATIDWSYHLLTGDEGRLFVWLSVFSGPFSLDGVLAIAGGDLDDPLRLLAGLVRQSMVAVVGNDQYRLLDTPRAYGRELLLSDPAVEVVHERLARFAVQLAAAAADDLPTGKQQASLVQLRAQWPNLRASIDWCFANAQDELGARTVASLAWFFMLEGMFAEGLAYYRRAQEAAPRLSRHARAGTSYGIGLLAAPLGRLHDARVAAAASVELAREDGDTRAVADGLSALSVTEWAQGDLAAAADHQDEALGLYRSLGDPWREVDVLVLRARTALDQRDPSAPSLLEVAIPLARSLQDHHAVGIALVQLAHFRVAEGDYAGAVDAAEEALEAHEALLEPEAIAGALHVLGRARLGLGAADEARSLHLRALDLAAAIGHVGAMCEAVEDLAAIDAYEGALVRARTLLEAAEAERRRRGVPHRALESERLRELRRELGLDRGPSPEHPDLPVVPWEALLAQLRSD